MSHALVFFVLTGFSQLFSLIVVLRAPSMAPSLAYGIRRCLFGQARVGQNAIAGGFELAHVLRNERARFESRLTKLMVPSVVSSLKSFSAPGSAR
jgi:hypothetical protein